jgi:hypothetical protein
MDNGHPERDSRAGRPAPHPAGIHALQWTAGNAAVARWVQRRLPEGSNREEHFATKPTEHPEWPEFQRTMREGGFSTDDTETAWQLLLGGLAEQGQLNDAARRESDDRQQQREHRATNDWYRQLVALVGDHLRIETPTMALWSGGFDASVYAQSKGHTPLEFTRVGRCSTRWSCTPTGHSRHPCGTSCPRPSWNAPLAPCTSSCGLTTPRAS